RAGTLNLWGRGASFHARPPELSRSSSAFSEGRVSLIGRIPDAFNDPADDCKWQHDANPNNQGNGAAEDIEQDFKQQFEHAPILAALGVKNRGWRQSDRPIPGHL
ncbi:MAG TPA: hypothetical protein VHY20_14515, partial [Pirellulales bacterium]|nr:hypothetical protein [Pirellulales bacterium]